MSTHKPASGKRGYVINDDALDYMESQKLPKGLQNKFKSQRGICFENDNEFKDNLALLNIQSDRHVPIATEGAPETLL